MGGASMHPHRCHVFASVLCKRSRSAYPDLLLYIIWLTRHLLRTDTGRNFRHADERLQLTAPRVHS
jgi:hypothetical protein